MVSSRQSKSFSIGPNSRPKRSRWRRRIRAAGWTAGAIILALALLRNAVVGPLLVRSWSRWSTGRGGPELSVESFSGSWLGSLALEGVRWTAPGLGLQTFEAERVGARYNLWKLVRSGWTGLESVEARAGQVVWVEGEPETKLREEEGPSALPSDLLTLPLVALERIGVTVERADGTRFELDSASFQSQWPVDARDRLELELSCPIVRIETPGHRWRQRSIGAVGVLTSDHMRVTEWMVDSQTTAQSGELRFEAGQLKEASLELFPLESGPTLKLERGAAGWSWIATARGFSASALRAWLAEEFPEEELGSLSISKLDLDVDGVIPGAASELGRWGGSIEIDDWESGGRSLEHIDAQFAFDGNGWTIAELNAEHEGTELRMADGAFSGDLSNLMQSGAGTFELRSADIPAALSAMGWGGTDAWQREIPEHQLLIEGALGDGALQFEEAILQTEGARIELQNGRLALDAEQPGNWSRAQFDVDLLASASDLAPIGRLFGRAGWGGEVQGLLRLRGSLDAPRGTADLVGESVQIAEDWSLDSVELDVDLTDTELRIERARGEGALASWNASGRVLLSQRRVEDLALEVIVEGDEASPLTVAADLNGPFDAMEGAVSADAANWKWNGREFDRIRLDAHWSGTTLRVAELKAKSGPGDVRASGTARFRGRNAGSAILQTCLLRAGEQDLALSGPATLTWSDGRVSVEPFELEGEAGRITGNGNWDGPARTSSIDLDVESLRLGDLLRPWQTFDRDFGAWTASVSAGWTAVEGWRGQSSGNADGLQLVTGSGADANGESTHLGGVDSSQSTAGRAQWDLVWSDGLLEVRSAKAELGELGNATISGSAPWDPDYAYGLGPGDLNLELESVLAFAPASELWPELGQLGQWKGAGSLDIRGEFGGQWDALTAALSLRADGAHARYGFETRPKGAILFPGPADGSVDVTLDAAGLQINQFNLTLPGFERLGATGQVGMSNDLTEWLSDPPSFGAMPAAGRVVVAAGDLSALAKQIPALRRLGGSLDLDFAIDGTVGEPNPNGRLSLADGELRLDAAIPALREVKLEARWVGERIELQHLSGELGGAQVGLGGWIEKRRGQEPELNLTLVGDGLLLYRAGGIKVRANSNLKLGGKLSSLLLSGRLGITDSRYVKNVNWFGARGGGPPTSQGVGLFELREAPLADMRFDLVLETDDPFVLKNNLLKGGLRPDLRLVGTGRVPRLLGPIYVEPTRVALPAEDLRIDAGVIDFREDDLLGPHLEILGDTIISGHTITVQVTGPLDRYDVLISSTPPLRQDDLVTLLATGELPKGSLGRTTAQDAATTTAYYLAKDAIRRWLGDESTGSSESIGDRVSIYSGGEVSRSGAQTAEVSLRLSDRDKKRPVTLITGERDAFDEINLGLRFLFKLP